MLYHGPGLVKKAKLIVIVSVPILWFGQFLVSVNWNITGLTQVDDDNDNEQGVDDGWLMV